MTTAVPIDAGVPPPSKAATATLSAPPPTDPAAVLSPAALAAARAAPAFTAAQLHRLNDQVAFLRRAADLGARVAA